MTTRARTRQRFDTRLLAMGWPLLAASVWLLAAYWLPL
jgi:hypothetical protein